MEAVNQDNSSSFVLLHRPSGRQLLAAGSGLLLILLLLRWHVLLSYSYAYLGGAERDAGLYIWLLQSATAALQPGAWFNTHAFFPYTRTLAWSDNYLLPVFAAQILQGLGLSLPATHNTIILSAQLLNGLAAYILAFALSGRSFLAFVSGTAFMTLPFLSAHLGHPQLQFAFWLPAALYSLLRFHQRPSWLWAYLSGLIIFLAFLTTVYYSLFLVVTLGLITLGLFLQKPGTFAYRNYLKLALGGLVGILPLLALLPPYLDVRATFGSRFLYEPFMFAADAWSFVSSNSFNLLYGGTAVFSHPEAQLFPGILITVVTAAAFLRISASRYLLVYRLAVPLLLLGGALTATGVHQAPWRGYLAGFFLWAALLCCGLLLYRLGQLERRLQAEYISSRGILAAFLFTAVALLALAFGPLRLAHGGFAPGPFGLLYHLVPGFDALRAIGRIGVFALGCLIFILPLTLGRWIATKRHATALVGALLLLVLLENYQIRYPLEEPPPRSSVYSWVKKNAQAIDAVIVLPFSGALNEQVEVASWSEFARIHMNYLNNFGPVPFAIVNGYSGQRSHIMKEFPRRLRNFPDENSLNALGEIGSLRYILFDSTLVPEFSADRFESALARFSNRMSFLHKDEAGVYVFELKDTTAITPDFVLRAPSYPAGSLHLELMGLSAGQAAQLDIQVFLRKHSEEFPFVLIPLRPNGAWDTFSFSLPPTSDRVRPLLVTFKVPDGSRVYLRKRQWQKDPMP